MIAPENKKCPPGAAGGLRKGQVLVIDLCSAIRYYPRKTQGLTQGFFLVPAHLVHVPHLIDTATAQF